MRHVLLLPLVLAVLLLAPSSRTRKPEGKDEKRFTLDVKGKTWPEVFQWLTSAADKPLITSIRPTGTCQVDAPPDRRYTLNQVIDLLNEDLLSKDRPTQLLLFVREHNFILYCPNEIIDTQPPSVPVDHLVRFPRTEIVHIVLRLKTLKAADLEPQVRKMLGPHGAVVALKGSNRLVIRDQVAILRWIVRFIDDRDRLHKP